MAQIRRILKLLGALVAFAVYVWFAAVRALPSVKRRKAKRRARRAAVSGERAASGPEPPPRSFTGS